MGNAKIFVGSTEIYYAESIIGQVVPTNFNHTFLFYDNDGDLSTTNDQYVIQGEPNSANPLTNELVVFVDQFAGAYDALDLDTDNDGIADINPSTLNLVDITSYFSNGEDGWQELVAHASSLGTYSSEYGYYNTGFDYNIFFQNCNALTNTLLVGAGTNLILNIPEGTGDYVWLTDIPGYSLVLDGALSDDLALAAGGDYLFIDQADSSGADTLRIESGASVRIIAADGNAPVSDIDIVLTDITGGVTYRAVGWDDLAIYVNGEEVAYIEDGRSLAAGVDLNLKYDSGSGVVLLKDLTNLTSADLESTSMIGSTPWVSNTLTWYGVVWTGSWDPLVIDLDGDGLAADYMTLENGSGGFGGTRPVYFDLNGDGFAEATTWHGDGFLVQDLNANGRIDDGSEMFGTAAQDGFSVLAAYDDNQDGVIDSSDEVWSDLLIWQDANTDAQTQSDELLSLGSLGITGINLASTNGSGPISQIGTVTTTSGTAEIGNYVFSPDTLNSRYAQDYDFDIRAAFLPDLRGYNNIPDMRIALSLDNDESDPDSLMSIVQDIASYSLPGLFENWDTVKSKIDSALFRWAGVDGVDPESRGEYVDARYIEFVEKYMGENFIDSNGWGNNPGSVQAQAFYDLWDVTIVPNFIASILVQTQASEIFGNAEYSFAETRLADHLNLAINQNTLDELHAGATALSTTEERQAFWLGVGEFIMDATQSIALGHVMLSSAEQAKLKAAIEASDSALTWDDTEHDPDNGVTSIEYRLYKPIGETIIGDENANDYRIDSIYAGTDNEDTIQGLGGDDYLLGGAGDDRIEGGDGNDTLLGGEGYDVLDGGNGNDVLKGQGGSAYLIGGAGNDWMSGPGTGSSGGQVLAEGGDGDDTYEISGGIWIDETTGSGYDTIYTNAYNVTASSVTMRRIGNHDLEISTNSGTVVVRGHFNTETIPVELFFADEDDSSIDLTNLTQNFTTFGTEFDDVIGGIESGSGTVDVIWGGDGNDTIAGGTSNDSLYGEEGNDTLTGGDGDDLLVGGSGDDTYIASAGNDTINFSSQYETLVFEDVTELADLDFDYYYGTGNDLIISHGTGTITLKSGYQGAAIDEFQFVTDGIVYNHDIKITQHGTSGNDTITGITTSMNGFNPDDTLYGYDGDDTFSAGDGDDKAYGGNGNDTMRLNDGADYAEGGAGSDFIEGEDGADILYGGDGDDALYGLTQYDSAGYGGASETFVNELYGEAGNDDLYGDEGNDILDGGTGDDRMWGNLGDDTYYFGSGLDRIFEAGGTDKVIFDETLHVDDLTFSVVNNYATIIQNSGVDELKTDRRTGSSQDTPSQRVDTLEFSDGLTLNWQFFGDSNHWKEGEDGDQYDNVVLGSGLK